MPNKFIFLVKKTIIGVMSGTSLDGLDICAVNFNKTKTGWSFEIIKSTTIKYSNNWSTKLSTATNLNGLTLSQLNIDLGHYFGTQIKNFITKNNLIIDLIASHGHTIFHQPDKFLTLQIGCGQTISSLCNIPVAYNFRAKDVSLGGQGAPLVPIGDKYLFNDYDICINLGGIANLSYDSTNGERIAYDICPFNMGLNYIANTLNLAYDADGEIAKSGKIDQTLLKQLNQLEFYSNTNPKSLGVEWFNAKCLPLLKNSKISTKNKLRTFSEHISTQIASDLNTISGKNVLLTGGGTYNSFCIDLLQTKCAKQIHIPTSELIDFKEALIFAFLGLLKNNNETNVLKSVTGASRNSSSGIIVTP